MSSEQLLTIIPATLSATREAGGYATKTKLLKYLYLIDIEHYRRVGKIATGFRWLFHKYGPWAGEYDEVLDRLVTDEVVRLNTGTREDLDTQFLDVCGVHPGLDQLGWSYDLQATVRRIIDTWANRPTGEILDYVYFHTEPMEGAKRGDELDFSKIERSQRTQFYKRSRSFDDEEELLRARRKLRKAFKQQKASLETETRITPPRYDEEFWNALHVIKTRPE